MPRLRNRWLRVRRALGLPGNEPALIFLVIAPAVFFVMGLGQAARAVTLRPGDIVISERSLSSVGGAIYHLVPSTSEFSTVASGGLLGSAPDGIAVDQDGAIVTVAIGGHSPAVVV
jgi:hypothetical protein